MEHSRCRYMGAVLVLIAGMAGGTTHAHDRYHLDGERVYLGEADKGRPHGEGRMLWSSGAVHVGTWVDGARHGTGTYRDADGATYVGQYRDGERHGHGRFTWPDGRSYDGEWQAGMRHGEGIEKLPSGLIRRCTWAWGEVVSTSCKPSVGKIPTSETTRITRVSCLGTRRCRLSLEEVRKGTRCPR